jgi:hypothetical protein
MNSLVMEQAHALVARPEIGEEKTHAEVDAIFAACWGVVRRNLKPHRRCNLSKRKSRHST